MTHRPQDLQPALELLAEAESILENDDSIEAKALFKKIRAFLDSGPKPRKKPLQGILV